MDYLQRYSATARINVNMELAERFDWSMRNHGDKPIKQQMATARRAATTVATLLKDFTGLPDSQAQQLRQSANTLRALAESLEGLARFAKGYQAFYKAELQREHEARLDKLSRCCPALPRSPPPPARVRAWAPPSPCPTFSTEENHHAHPTLSGHRGP